VPKRPEIWLETRRRWAIMDAGRAVLLSLQQQPSLQLFSSESATAGVGASTDSSVVVVDSFAVDALQERSAEHQRFFFEAFKITKTLCPGLHRVKLELGEIIEQCKEKSRRLKQLVRDWHANGIVPMRFSSSGGGGGGGEIEELLRFDALNYHALDLTAKFTDQEVLRCVDMMHHLWELCRVSPYVRVNGPQCLVMRNHCIAVLYSMTRGIVISGRVVVPANPKFARRGFLVGLNSINRYDFKRKQYTDGMLVLKHCLYSLQQQYPIDRVLFHRAMEQGLCAKNMGRLLEDDDDDDEPMMMMVT
jgi:hypothetical protein